MLCLALLVFALFWSGFVRATDWKVSGGDSELTDNILLHLQDANGLEGLSRKQRERRLDLAITRAGQALGYYRLRYRIEWRGDGDEKNAVVTVEPGPQVIWGDVRIELRGAGAQSKVLRTWQQQHPFSSMEPLHHGDYERYKTEGLNKALQLGYLGARFVTHQLSVDVAQLKANVQWVLETGELHTVSEVRFYGSAIKEDVLRRLCPVKPADPYNARALADIFRRFIATGYFRDVKVNPIAEGATGQIIEVSLEDADYHQMTTGFGFSTDTGPRVRLGWDQPVVNDRGHQWYNSARLSEPEQDMTSEYRVPITDPLSHYLAFDVGWKRKSNKDTESRQLNAGVAWNRLFDSGWQRVYKVELEREDYQQGSEPRNTALYLIPGVTLSLTGLEGAIRDPHRGYKLWLGASGSTLDLGAEHDFVRLSLGAKYLYPLLENHVIATRFELGAISTSAISDVPASQRFFTGGDQTVRGYDYESLAPMTAEGELIGGRYLNVGSIEYRWRYTENWDWALFYDAGRAYSDSDAKWAEGAGTGLHWRSPIGPVRFDLGWPINNEDHKTVRLHVTMGPSL